MTNTDELEIESNVRSYCRSFPAKFVTAKGASVVADNGDLYLDFLCGCGSLNYGHNHPDLQRALVDYITGDGIAHGLDLHTNAKFAFLESFHRSILKPRSLPYRVQFPGPTGANAVEAAIKLARKVTGRSNIIAFTNAFHGCSLGALALTANTFNRGSAASLVGCVHRAPFDGYLGPDVDTAQLLARQIADPSGGIDKPAAIVLELIQGEGGLNVAGREWVQKIAQVAHRHGALLIVDEIQTGCGRTGPFFAFEEYGIVPDIVLLAKSISGFGLPMALVLISPEFDQWGPGEHSGTFRGNNHAFVTAAAALHHFWSDRSFQDSVSRKGDFARSLLTDMVHALGFRMKGRGLMLGIDVLDEKLAARIRTQAYNRKLLLELCGPRDQVVKLMPALTICDEELERGVTLLRAAIADAFCPARSGNGTSVAA